MNPSSTTPNFSAPWGRTVTVVTALATCLLVGLPLIGVFGIPPAQSLARNSMVLLPLALLAGTALFAVRGYSLPPGSLLVHRPLWTTRIPLAGLLSAEIDPHAMEGSLRLAGNGGLFACTGLFRNRHLGTYRAFVTDLTRCVVLRLPARTLVVSPDRPADFVDAVRTAAGLTRPAPGA